MANKVYVLGASGFVGKKLIAELGQSGTLATFKVGRNNADLSLNLETGNYVELLEQVKSGDTVVFLAAISSPDICKNQTDLAYRVNVESTLKLITELVAAGVKVLFSSSDAVFSGISGICNEATTPEPNNPYAKMKYAVERGVENLELVKVARFSYIVGKGDLYTNMLNEAAKNGTPVEVFSGFERFVVTLDDVVSGLISLINNWDDIPHKVINFSGPELISRSEITKLYKHYIAPSLTYQVTEAPPGFWSSRPKSIEMESNYFNGVLGRPASTIEQYFKGEYKSD